MKIPNNCCECKFCSFISEMGYRYCTNNKRDKKQLNKLFQPAYNIQPLCPYLT